MKKSFIGSQFCKARAIGTMIPTTIPSLDALRILRISACASVILYIGVFV